MNLEYKDDQFVGLEKLGKEALKHTGFALVGGGIGERLNSKYIKLSLTSDLVRGYSFLEDYCKFFHAIEVFFSLFPFNPDHHELRGSLRDHDVRRHQRRVSLLFSLLIPSTIKLLESHQYFDLKPENVTIMKQNGVPAICNTQGEIAVREDGHILFKPHGHGDIHLLMSQHGVPEAWAAQGIRYVVFFQDTNGLSMHGFPLLLGVMEKFGYAFGSMAIVRRPGEKVGGICKLVRENGESLTCNVEYNQLEDVLKACTGQGDVPNAQGNSKCE